MNHLFLDIETLGNRPGSAIIEMAAAVFDPATGKIGAGFQQYILPHPSLYQDDETIAWHAERGSYPFSNQQREEAVTVAMATDAFHYWLQLLDDEGTIELKNVAVWSWGSNFDFPILHEATKLVPNCKRLPWKYYQERCARTVYKLAFGDDAKPAPRTHRALQDVSDAIGDLHAALQVLKGHHLPDAGNLVHPVMECAHCRQPFLFGQDRIATDDGHMHEACALAGAGKESVR